MSNSAGDPSPVTVLGLGAMGSALANAFLDAKHPTTVWNRTPGRADPLVARGAHHAPTVRDAVTASPLIVACVLDYDVVHEIFDPVTDVLSDRTMVNLTSGLPEAARRTAAWAHRHHIGYLDGAVMVPTTMVGTPEALILYSGDRHRFDTHAPSLEALAGDNDFLGEDPGLAASYDLGMLDIFFLGMTGFLHASALVTADGVSATALLPYAQRMAALLQPTFAELAAEVDAGRHPGEQDNLVMELSALNHLVEASTARGVAAGPPELVRSLVRRAIAQGHGQDGFSRVIDPLREPAT